MGVRKKSRTVAMLASGLTIVGLIAMSPDVLPPAAVAGMILFSFGLIASGLRRSDDGSVSA